jgi:predicted nuclease of predicted toxin-antitoxin system
MRVLVDECAPRALKQFLTKHGHQCFTVQEAGWSGKQNGELLAAAEPEFDVLITVDTNIRYQQNMEGRSIAIVVLHSSSNRLEHLRQHFPACGLARENQAG